MNFKSNVILERSDKKFKPENEIVSLETRKFFDGFLVFLKSPIIESELRKYKTKQNHGFHEMSSLRSDTREPGR